MSLACGACAEAPFGEILVVVDTDVSVPRFVSALRVDLYADDGTWYESRDVVALSRAEWPLSFSVYSDEPGAKAVRLRLRAFPAAQTRVYKGELPLPAPYSPPPFASDLEGLCADPPLLPARVELTQRHAERPFLEHVVAGDCTHTTRTGSVAARIEIPAAGTYRFEVVRSVPDGSRGIPGGDVTLAVRRDCASAGTQLGCADNIDFSRGNFLPRLDLSLDAGTYFLVTGGGAKDSPADVTLRWALQSEWVLPNVAVPPPPVEPALPRLVVAGTDVTPASEPLPALAIDRLVDLRLTYGERRRAWVHLRGECLGTRADLDGSETCIDTAGARVSVSPTALDDELDRGGGSASGSWAAEQARPCTVAARTRSQTAEGLALYDEEVCVPGGAFTLGSDLLRGAGDRSTTPRRVVAVEPFLLDRYEVTVGRYRDALRRGFAPLDFDPAVNLIQNDGPLLTQASTYGCTWNGDASGPAARDDREAMPLTCIGHKAARALCRFLGGDLPTSAEWEYAARGVGAVGDGPHYPWGDDEPDCARAAFARNGGTCSKGGARGPVQVDAEPFASGDVTPLGIVGLGGSESEWARDAFAPYDDPCWTDSPLHGVLCDEMPAPLRMSRGGNWWASENVMLTFIVNMQAPEYPASGQGVRCMRPGVQ